MCVSHAGYLSHENSMGRGSVSIVLTRISLLTTRQHSHPQTQELTIQLERNSSVLALTNLTRHDSGTYICMADNGVGEPVGENITLVVMREYLPHTCTCHTCTHTLATHMHLLATVIPEPEQVTVVLCLL